MNGKMKKRWMAVAVFFAVLMNLIFPFSKSICFAADGTYRVYVDTGYLALRTDKSFESTNEIGQLYTGDTVEVCDDSDSVYWYVFVPSLQKYGYVNRDYLQQTDVSQQELPEEQCTVSVASGYLALRTDMEFDKANEIGRLYSGDKVTVVDSNNSTYWYVYAPMLDKYGYVNKNYLKDANDQDNSEESVIDEKDIPFSEFEQSQKIIDGNTCEYGANTIEEMQLALYWGAVERKEVIDIYYYGDDYQNACDIAETELLDRVGRYDSQETANDFDYLMNDISGYSILLQCTSTYVLFSIQMEYFDNRDQQKIVDAKVKSTLQSLELNEKNDFEKVKLIHDWIKKNIVYDDTLQEHSAYSGLENGYTVCQGFALITYKMLTEAGIENRIISGEANNGEETNGHAWNLVKVDNKWYYLDMTWDTCLNGYNYFLIGSDKMDKDHFAADKFQTNSFIQYYDISTNDHVDKPKDKKGSFKLPVIIPIFIFK